MESRVVITHFEHPHRFWYKRCTTSLTSSNEENLFLAEIDKCCRDCYGGSTEAQCADSCYQAAEGEMVAVYIPLRDTWIRGKVMTILPSNADGRWTYRIWSVDEGIPREASSLDVEPLLEKYASEPAVSVRQGSVRNIIPARQMYDTDEERVCKRAVEEWDASIVAALRTVIESAERTCFENATCQTIAGEEVYCGDLRFTTRQKKVVDASSIILSVGPALVVDDQHFLTEILKTRQKINANHSRGAVAVTEKVLPSIDGPKTDNVRPSVTGPETAPAPRSQPEVKETMQPKLPRTLLAKLKHVSLQKKQPVPAIPEVKEASVNGPEATKKSTEPTPTVEPRTFNGNLLLDPKSYLTLARKVPREPAVSAPHVLSSSWALERYTLEFRRLQVEPPKQMSSKVPNMLKHKIARHQRSASECSEGQQSSARSECSEDQPKQVKGSNSSILALALPSTDPVVVSSSSNLEQAEDGREETQPNSQQQHASRKLPNFLKQKLAQRSRKTSQRTTEAQLDSSTVSDCSEGPANQTVASECSEGPPDQTKSSEGTSASPWSTFSSPGIDQTPSLSSTKLTEDGDGCTSLTAEDIYVEQVSSSLPLEVKEIDEQPPAVEEEVPSVTNHAAALLLTAQRSTEIRRFERMIKEEQSVYSRLRHHRMLVHGHPVPKPIDSIANANFCSDVYDELALLRINTVYRLQAYAWPHIMRGNSIVCVNSSGTGKTFAFLPAVCSLIKYRIEEGLVSSDAGPVGIAVCYSSQEVQRIAYIARRMLRSAAHKHLGVIEFCGVRRITQTCNALFSGCALLVTTIPAYRRLYETMPEVFDRKRIQIVAIDNIEEMLRHFTADLLLLCKNCDKPDLQMIVMASFWHPTLASFVRKYKNMILCIGAYLEAAVYAKVQFLLRLQRDDGSKQEELARYIRAHDHRAERTIVFASTIDDLEPIIQTLRQYSINHVVCSDSSVIHQHDGFRHWDDRQPGDMVVLICLDEMLGDLIVSKAQHIIHYSLPSSWSSFTRRFATSFGYYDSPYLQSVKAGGGSNAQVEKGRPSSLVLLDENNNHQLPKLIDFLELHNVRFPATLATLAQSIRSVNEYVKTIDGTGVSALCPHLLALAACRSYKSCPYRHTLMVHDLPTDQLLLPKSGTVRLNILHVFSPAHFAARIVAHRTSQQRTAGGGVSSCSSSSWTLSSGPKEFLLHDIRMQAYFASPDRHQMYGGQVMRNDLCALQVDQNYWRCRIVHFEPSNEQPTTVDVQLRLIDSGRMVYAKSTSLLWLPDQFRTLPGQAIDVRIAGLVPHDFEEDWDKTSTVTVQRWIEEHSHRSAHHHVDAKVVLALRDVIWVEELLLVEQLDGLKTAVVTAKVKASIVSKQFGVLNRESFDRIRELALECSGDSGDSAQANSSIPPAECKDSSEELAPVSAPESDDVVLPSSPPPKEASATDQPKPPMPRSKSPTTTVNEAETIDVVNNNSLSSSNSSFEVLLSPTDGEKDRRHSFETLERGKQHRVAIGQYFAPDQFYVYELEKMLAINETIRAFTATEGNVKPLNACQLHPGGYCFAFCEAMYRRCRIVELGVTEVVVFLLDFGGTISCPREQLYEIPTDVLRQHPFAAIEGTLGLITPMQGASWSEEISNAIYDDVLEKYNDAGTLVAIVLPKQAGIAGAKGCHRYELLLADANANDPYSIVTELVHQQLVMFDGSKLYDGDDGNDDNDDNDDAINGNDDDGSFVQLNFTHEEVRSILANLTKEQAKGVTMMQQQELEASRRTSRRASRSSIVDITEEAKEQEQKDDRDSRAIESSTTKRRVVRRKQNNSPMEPCLPRLSCDYRFPPTVWRQDEFFVTLCVSAPEVSRYQLTVRVQSVLLRFIRDDHRYLLALNLFGPIDPERSTHEVRGLTIVIRLARLPGSTWRWPTLLNHTGHFTWLRKAMGSVASRRKRQQRHYRVVGGSSGSGSDSSSDAMAEIEWTDMLPMQLNDNQIDIATTSSMDEDDDMGVQAEDAMEEEIFFRHR